MGKGEIARYEQFLHFPQCFQKAGFVGASKGVIVCEWVNCNYFYCSRAPDKKVETESQNAEIQGVIDKPVTWGRNRPLINIPIDVHEEKVL